MIENIPMTEKLSKEGWDNKALLQDLIYKVRYLVKYPSSLGLLRPQYESTLFEIERRMGMGQQIKIEF